MKILALLSSLFLVIEISSGQPYTARQMASGSTGSVSADENSMFTNPAGLIWKSGMYSLVNYSNHFLLTELDHKMIGVKYSKNNYGTSITYNQTGDSRLLYQQVGIAYAQKFGNQLSLGAKINHQQMTFSESYGSKSTISAVIGFNFKVSSGHQFSFVVINPSRQWIYKETQERMPAGIQLGYAHEFSEKFTSMLEIEKVSEVPLNFKVGLDYALFSTLSLRTGYQSLMRRISAGFGLQFNRFVSDLAFSYEPSLGTTSSISLSWHIVKGDEPK